MSKAPIHLAGLSEREAITDALNRTLLAYDLNDVTLLESALTKDIVFEINGQVTEGIEAIKTGNFAFVGPINTGHVLGNVRIDHREGAKTASVGACALANHFRPGTGLEKDAPYFMAFSLYDAEAVKESDGLWKIKRWKLNILWSTGDPSVLGL